MVSILVSVLVMAVAVFLVAQILPGIKLKSFGTAIIVAIVYSLINWLLGWIIGFFAWPLIMITFGLFVFVINTFFLWLTDKVLDDFDIDGCGTTLIASLLISLVSWVMEFFLKGLF